MDYEIAFLLALVLMFAWYIQVHILPSLAPKIKKKSSGIFKARIINDEEDSKNKWATDAEIAKEAAKLGKEALDAQVLNSSDKGIDKEGLDLTLKLLGAEMSQEEEDGLAFSEAIVDLLIYLLDLNVSLKDKYDDFQKIGKFNQKLHSSNLLSRLKIEEEVLQEKLDKLKLLDTKKEVFTKFKIISEHIKMIDQIFSDTGILESYMEENAMMLHSRFLEVRALSRELFAFLNKLNPEMAEEHEELIAFMQKYPEYFKIKTEK
ncbi:MAG: hypothetical protein HRT47_03005 [Candidatus Caenarcaniphilales bacterium]|nr:hypothetical protein [Candidatus Caenarcaniphilales bacterium]